MKHLYGYAGALALAASLAACGGGGGSAPSIPVTGGGGTTTYTASIQWTGGAEQKAQALARRALGDRAVASAALSGAALLIAPDNALFAGANGSGAILLASVSPAPASTPTPVTFSVNAPNVTPTGSPTSVPGYVGAQNVKATTPGAAGAGSASASIGAPVNATPTTNVIVYKAAYLGCAVSASGGAGVTIADNGTASPASDPSTADLYLTGPYCSGAYAAAAGSANDGVLHTPYGGTLASVAATSFDQIASVLWLNTRTTYSNADLVAAANAFIFKTHDGTICKSELVMGGWAAGGAMSFSGPISCHGTGPDGF